MDMKDEAPATAHRELGDHAGMDVVDDWQDLSDRMRAAKKPKVRALWTVGGLAVNILQQTVVAMMLISSVLPGKPVYGHLSGELLDPVQVQEGRDKERAQMKEFGVYKRVLRSDAKGKRVRAQWLDDVKYNDDGTKFVRSRFVAMQVAWELRSDCFAGTPALLAVRLVLSFAATMIGSVPERVIALYDVSVAFWHALLDEDIWIEPPAGEEPDSRYVWQLLKALYGTRRAALLFQEYVITAMKTIGFFAVQVASQVFYHPGWLVLAVVHGDDFAAAGTPKSLDKLDEAMDQFFTLKKLPRVGPPSLGGVAAGRYTKRWITCDEKGFGWSADQQHIDKVIDWCCGGKPTTVRKIGPGSKSIGKSVKEAANELDAEDRARYRTMVPTAHYVAADRPDIQYTTGVLMRSLEAPTVLQQLQLHRLGVYLQTVPTLVWRFDFQKMPCEVYVEVDSDWAQCQRTRRSTGGGLVFWGGHCVDSYCAQQHSVALSSAEAELHEIVQGAARGLFLRHILETMLPQAPVVVVATDSSAAHGISHRLGSGRVRHLEAKELWIQEKVRDKQVRVVKISTSNNRADLMTKYLDAERHHFLLGRLPLTAVTRCLGTQSAVAAVFMVQAMGAEARRDSEQGETEFNILRWLWLLTCFVSVVVGWLLARFFDRRGRQQSRRTKDKGVQTDGHEKAPCPAWVYFTPEGKVYHVKAECASRRTDGPVKSYRCCRTCG